MDFSDYNVKHPNYDKTNKKVLGKFKDEMGGKIMVRSSSVRSKSGSSIRSRNRIEYTIGRGKLMTKGSLG